MQPCALQDTALDIASCCAHPAFQTPPPASQVDCHLRQRPYRAAGPQGHRPRLHGRCAAHHCRCPPAGAGCTASALLLLPALPASCPLPPSRRATPCPSPRLPSPLQPSGLAPSWASCWRATRCSSSSSCCSCCARCTATTGRACTRCGPACLLLQLCRRPPAQGAQGAREPAPRAPSLPRAPRPCGRTHLSPSRPLSITHPPMPPAVHHWLRSGRLLYRAVWPRGRRHLHQGRRRGEAAVF